MLPMRLSNHVSLEMLKLDAKSFSDADSLDTTDADADAMKVYCSSASTSHVISMFVSRKMLNNAAMSQVRLYSLF